MLLTRSSLAVVLSTALIAPSAVASGTTTTGAQTAHHPATTRRHRLRRPPRLRGQQAILPERVTEIQQALIREHYLTGAPTGRWDDETQAAMQRYQGDQGWQTKLMPDSRALKKLGLGPDYSTAINARNTSFGDPPPNTSIPQSQAAGFAAASGAAKAGADGTSQIP